VHLGDRYKNNLQSRLYNLAVEYKNIFIIAVFDCCREKKDGITPVVPKRGDKEAEIVHKEDLAGQIFCIFGCKAGGWVSVDSILSNYLLKEGKEQIERTGEFTTLNNLLLR